MKSNAFWTARGKNVTTEKKLQNIIMQMRNMGKAFKLQQIYSDQRSHLHRDDGNEQLPICGVPLIAGRQLFIAAYKLFQTAARCQPIIEALYTWSHICHFCCFPKNQNSLRRTHARKRRIAQTTKWQTREVFAVSHVHTLKFLFRFFFFCFRFSNYIIYSSTSLCSTSSIHTAGIHRDGGGGSSISLHCAIV